MKYEVGQKLWWVPFHNKYHPEDNGGYEVEVVKVAIKYVTIRTGPPWPSEHRFLKDTGFENTDWRPGQAFQSSDALEAKRALDAAWEDLNKTMRAVLYGRPPVGLTIEQIGMIKAALEPLK